VHGHDKAPYPEQIAQNVTCLDNDIGKGDLSHVESENGVAFVSNEPNYP